DPPFLLSSIADRGCRRQVRGRAHGGGRHARACAGAFRSVRWTGHREAAQIVAAPVGSCLRWWDGGYDARRTDRRAHRRSRAAPGEGPRTTDLATRPAVLDGRRRALG